MIQRIQSVYLLIAAAFMLLFYMVPICVFVTDTFSYQFFSCHLTHPENLEPPVALMPLTLLPILSAIISLYSIFLYKKRKLQMRMGKINMLLIFTVFVIMLLYIYRIDALLAGKVKIGFSGIFPLLAFIFIVMANKGIKHDDDLVRSADRIR